MQYEEACERVYGEPYADWKKKHQKKASGWAGVEIPAGPRIPRVPPRSPAQGDVKHHEA